MKTALSICLSLFLFSGSACSKEKDGALPQEGRDGAPAKMETDAGPRVPKASFLVFYFHGDARCPSCRKLEAYTEEAVRENFGEELESRRLAYQTVNVDEEPNRHFIEKYRLYSKSVVLVDARAGRSGRWKNLDKIWTLLHKKEAFKDYIAGEVGAFIKE